MKIPGDDAEIKAAHQTELNRLMTFGLSLEQADIYVSGAVKFLHDAKVSERRATLKIVAGSSR